MIINLSDPDMIQRRWPFPILVCGLGLVILVAVALVHNVPIAVNAKDKRAIVQFFPKQAQKTYNLRENGKPERWDKQIRQISYVQQHIIRQVPHTERIPRDHSREPAAVLKHGHGHCHDRARLLAKIYRWLGYDARQAFILNLEGFDFAFHALLTPGAAVDKGLTHALLDVRTKYGWMAVGTNAKWLGLGSTSKKKVYSLKMLAGSSKAPVKLADKLPGKLTGRFWPIYGLYSRHGRYYQPYTPYIPDMNILRFLVYFTGMKT